MTPHNQLDKRGRSRRGGLGPPVTRLVVRELEKGVRRGYLRLHELFLEKPEHTSVLTGGSRREGKLKMQRKEMTEGLRSPKSRIRPTGDSTVLRRKV